MGSKFLIKITKMITGEKITKSILLNVHSEIYEALRKISYEKNVSMTSIIIEAIQKQLKLKTK